MAQMSPGLSAQFVVALEARRNGLCWRNGGVFPIDVDVFQSLGG